MPSSTPDHLPQKPPRQRVHPTWGPCTQRSREPTPDASWMSATAQPSLRQSPTCRVREGHHLLEFPLRTGPRSGTAHEADSTLRQLCAEDARSFIRPQQFLDALVAHLTEEIMRETAWHVLIAELAAGAATNPALRELYRDIDENHRSTFAALLTSTGLVDTEQKARVAVRSLLAAVHSFALELTVDREAVSRDDIARTLQAIATTHVTHHVNTSSR